MRVHRFDWAAKIVVCKDDEAPPPGAVAARETPEGYLRVEGRINGCGVYEYENDAGERWGELRLEEHVGAPATLESWQIRAITDDHPPVWLDATNVDEYRRGSTGSNIRFDGHTWADIVIDSPELISKVKAGKTQLSCGYTCVLVPQQGELDGIAYDYIQTEIYGNHVAVVDLARGGPTCSLVFDGAARRRATPDHRGTDMPKEYSKKDAKLVTSEGAIEIPEAKLAAVMSLLAEPAAPADPAMGDQDEPVEDEDEPVAPPAAGPAPAAPKGDALAARVDMLEAENRRLKSDFATNVSARVSLVTTAREILGSSTNLDSMSDTAIQQAVIVAVNPDMKGKLKGKSADYVQAAYEMALDAHGKKTDSSGDLLALTGRASNNDGGGSLNDSYEQMLKDRRDGVEKVA